ncbi:hypothetical protein MMC17_009298 [Xylographa soralifera]|nr:hypothetical protein [Xylographa soralifera]
MDKPPMIDLHEKYGDIVRMGPNVLSFGKPEAIKDIYGVGKAWNKSGFYPVQAAVAKGESVQTLFSSGDIPWHNALRRAINPLFTATTAVSYEHLIDKTIDVFLEQWDARFAGKQGPEGVIDLASWLLYFSFDVIGELTYGSRHGFMESGRDSQGIISFLQKFGAYGWVMGPSPNLDKLFRHNPVLLWLERRGFYQKSTFPLVIFVAKRMKARVSYYETKRDTETKNDEDLLDKFFKAKEAHPKAMSEKEVLNLSLTMVLAGAETMSDPLPDLSSFFYYILRNPACYAKLLQELDTQLPARDYSSLKCDVDFTLAQKLPYMQACIQETYRMHPASAVLLERVVPAAGANISGEQIPGGTVVGVSSWTVHRNKAVFGDDAKDFRPERWLEASEEKVRLMERSMLHFGAGNHLCLGKNISAREIYKVVPSLLRTFKVELVDPEKEWTLVTTLSVRQEDVNVRIERRTA